MTQLALMREFLAAFGGNELTLGVTLGNWLLLMGLGAALGRGAGRLGAPSWWLLGGLSAVAILPPIQVFALRLLRDAVFPRGAAASPTAVVVCSLLALAPYCLLAGFLFPLTCALAGAAKGASETRPPREGEGIGRVYFWDSAGSVVGGVGFGFLLIRWLDHIALLLVPAGLCLLVVVTGIARSLGRQFGTVAGIGGALMLVAAASLHPDRVSTERQYPRQRLLLHANSPYGRVVVTEEDGQINIFGNGAPLASSHDAQRAEEAAHYAMAQRPAARRVLVIGGLLSGTAREVLKHPVAGVDCVELDPLLVEVGHRFCPDDVADARLRVVAADGRQLLRGAATRARYDVVIVDLPDPLTVQLNRFFTVEFCAEAKRALAKDGVLGFGLGRYENFVSPELARVLATAWQTAKTHFRSVLLLPGGRVCFLLSDGELTADMAARIEAAGVKTMLVKRSYLEVMLAPDRRAALARAVEAPAPVNRDFNPVLHHLNVRHWMRQFPASSAAIPTLLTAVLAVYLARLRGPSLAVFAGGFAGSGLTVVLLLAVQVACGAVYQQVGLVITLFMAGLAVGAGLAGRRQRDRGAAEVQRAVGLLGLAIAVLALVLPMAVPALTQIGGLGGGTGAALLAGGLGFGLAALTGLQFALAGRTAESGAILAASRLYTADFVGASLGALLTSALLLPLLGSAWLCAVVAGLNALVGIVVLGSRLRRGAASAAG